MSLWPISVGTICCLLFGLFPLLPLLCLQQRGWISAKYTPPSLLCQLALVNWASQRHSQELEVGSMGDGERPESASLSSLLWPVFLAVTVTPPGSQLPPGSFLVAPVLAKPPPLFVPPALELLATSSCCYSLALPFAPCPVSFSDTSVTSTLC